MQSYTFVDLDDTLFQTLRKCEGYTVGDQTIELQPRAYLKNGETISYATPKQGRLFNWISQTSRIIPVTARNFDAFSRVDLPFSDDVVLNHGAVILDKQRQLDEEWHARMTNDLREFESDFLVLWDAVERYAGNDVLLKPRLIDDFGVTWYGVIKHAEADEAALESLLNTVVKPAPAIAAGRVYYHINGNNLAIIPSVIAKSHAVRFLLKRYKHQHEAIFTVGIGDSQSDRLFMSLCDYAVIPRNTQLGEFLHGS